MIGVALVSAAASAGQTVLCVDVDATGPVHDGLTWCTAFTDLQVPLEIAAVGPGVVSEIRVAEGVYRPTVPDGDRGRSFDLVDGVALVGGFAGCGAADPDARDWVAYETILSGDLNGDDAIDPANNAENSYHVVTAGGTSDATVLDGFTLRGGNANGSAIPHDAGGGMRNASADPTVANCTFVGNSAVFGGGMENFNGANPTLVDCVFTDNEASFRGGGVHNKSSSPVLIDCVLTGNFAANSGGGIRSWDQSMPLLIGCTLAGNSAGFGGGMVNDESDATLISCTFSDNVSAETGGAMHNWISEPVVTNCVFRGNTALSVGGAIYNTNDSGPTIRHCAFTGNNAAGMGGTLFNLDSSPALIGCTLSNNVSGLNGGGMVSVGGSASTVTNSIVWGNSVGQIVGVPSTVTYSDVQGGFPGEGNINTDPLFADVNGGDVRLLSASPAIDAGDPAFTADADERDLDGHARVLCGRVDMGAYEFGIGDFECDRDVDVFDAAGWAGCLTGPDGGPFAMGCEALDFDGDSDVDLEDYGGFQRVFGGV